MEALKTTNQEIVHEGWLIKSPPTKLLWRARWRKRWFTLRHSGELPGQYFLEYYTDRRCRKLKGRIDLDQCEQVDAGLRFENRKQKYQYMFNVKTLKRIYYLVSENENDMNKWVDAICQVCGLKAYTQDEEQQMFHFESQESPPISPSSTISGPYIPISECISGRSLNDSSSLNSSQGPEHYDAPRRLAPSPPRSPTTTDADSAFTDDEWTAPVPIPNVNWDNFPLSGEPKSSKNIGDADIGSWSVKKRFGKLRIVDSNVPPAAEEIPAPPRPPKPPHMMPEFPSHNYLNLDGATESSKPVTPATPAPTPPATTAPSQLPPSSSTVITDETYDFPRSHQPDSVIDNGTLGRIRRNCYSNAAPTNTENRIFRYDFHDEEPSSPRSETSTTATYSNLPSPSVKDNLTPMVPTTMAPPPPVVYRELKPGRKTSDTLSIISNSESTISELSPAEHTPEQPPNINRKLKPSKSRMLPESPLQLQSPPGRGRGRAGPVVVNAHLKKQPSASEDDNLFDDTDENFYFQDSNSFMTSSNRRFAAMQYLDLDLGSSENAASTTLPAPQSPPSSTVYKTVDFLKTEAFNRTRQRVEEERKQCTDSMLS